MRLTRQTLAVAAAFAAVGCGPPPGPATDHRALSTTYSFRVTADPVPPFARERTEYKVVVRDRDSGQPIEGGQGRIFASNRGGASTWDGLVTGKELGTYYARLNFVTAGEWAIAIQFRSDSTKPLERVDWMQDVRNERQEIP
ncbi:MAG: hypothetical protein ABR543_18360 [Gemmatimonadaceae bacterium]